jgi:hypothetical protein
VDAARPHPPTHPAASTSLIRNNQFRVRLLGLVELPIYVMPDGNRLVVPRVLARTVVVTRNVVQVPEGHTLEELSSPGYEAEDDSERGAALEARQRFWTEFLADLTGCGKRAVEAERGIFRA